MYDEEKRSQLISTQGQESPLDLPGYEWVKNPPKNARPVLLGFQSSGIGRIMLEQESTITPSASPIAAMMEIESELEAEAETETETEADSEMEMEMEGAEPGKPVIIVKVADGAFDGTSRPISVTIDSAAPPAIPAFQPGPYFRVKGHNSEPLTREVLAGRSADKMNTNLTALNNAQDTAIQAKGELDYLRDKAIADAIRYRIALVEQEADKEVLSLMEAEAKALNLDSSNEIMSFMEASAGAQDLPPVNPDMVPIPPAVREIMIAEANAEPPGYPKTPVYIVEKPGVAFVPNGGTFEARVGPGGSVLANHVIERAGDLTKQKRGFHDFRKAHELMDVEAEKMKAFRAVINQPMDDAKASPEVEADLKPVINYSYIETSAEADAEAEVDAEAEAETEAEVEVDAEDLPPVNPDMVPIPPAVREIMIAEANAEPPGYPKTPVYIVEKPGVAFVPNGGTFEARVGPGGSVLANHVIERAGDLTKQKRGFHDFRKAHELMDVEAEKMKAFRAVINQPMDDAKASPEVEADLKPVINYN